MFLSCASAAGAMTSPYDSLVITSTMNNEYSYSFGGATPQVFTPSGDVRLRLDSNIDGNLSQIGVDFTSRLEGDSFYYLHNGYCVGTCSVSMKTSLTFTLANEGDTAVSVRWDSLITPGHLAQQGSAGTARYQFLVLQGNNADGSSQSHYEAYGDTWGWYDQFSNTGDGLFGFVKDTYSEGVGHNNAWSFADWSATALNLDLLTILPGETHTLLYYSVITMAMSDLCTDLSDCDGVQVAFGDPRNTGSIGSRMAAFSAGEPLIGREFEVYTTEGKVDQMFVKSDAPLPDPLPVVTSPGYSGPSFKTPALAAAVPEPGAWMMLLLGFGAMGGVLRSRRPVPAFRSARM